MCCTYEKKCLWPMKKVCPRPRKNLLPVTPALFIHDVIVARYNSYFSTMANKDGRYKIKLLHDKDVIVST